LQVEFPSSTAQLFNDGTISTACEGPLGAAPGGACFRPGDGIEETFTGTGIAAITSSHLIFDMADSTFASFTPEFNVLINDVVLGTYILANPGSGGSHLDLAFEHPAISGPDYTIKIIQTNTPPPATAAYNWIPGGTADIVPEPATGLLLGSGLALATCYRRRPRLSR
jgi:hypothetical protein